MRNAGVYDYSFDDLFDNKMRLAMPLDTDDSRYLKTVMIAIRKEGYHVSGTGDTFTERNFNRRRVKQKLRRLGTGEEYEIEITVADIEFEKTYDFEIPAGPRKGETIEKTDKRNMSKLMQKLIKEKKLDPDLLDWWQRRQTYYTKDSNYEEIEALMTGDVKEYMVIVSRHPIDVLRMSDIGNIHSCHSEGDSHFKCAVAEAKGHGPIAYLVEKKDYEDLLAGMYSEYDTADDPEAAFDVSEKFAKEKAEEFIRKYAIRHAKFYSSLVKLLPDREKFQLNVDRIKNHDRVKRNFNDLPSTAKDQLTYQAFHDAVTAAQKGQEWSLLTGDEHEREDLREIGDFDTQEIFKDSDRSVRGIVAASRVRIRKFYNQASDDTFAVPEHDTYGPHPPGFVEAVRKWTWEEQKYMFIDEGAAEEDQVLNAPRAQDIIRYGGSYEDTKDGELLNSFFTEAGEEKFTRDMGYNSYENFQKDIGDEGPDLYREYDLRVNELNSVASNTLEYFSAHGGVDEYDVGQPYVMGSATLELEFPMGWKGFEHDENNAGREYQDPTTGTEPDDDYFLSIPQFQYRDTSGLVRDLKKILNDALTGPKNRMYLSYDVDSWEVARAGRVPGDGIFRVTFNIEFEPENEANPAAFSGFIDDLKDFEGQYDQVYERMRRALVEEHHLASNQWDDTQEEREEIEDELKNFIVVGEDEDDPDGVVLFTLMGKNIDDSPDSEIATGIRFPIGKMPKKLDVGDFRKDYLIPKVLGGGKEKTSDRRFVSGGNQWRGQKLESTQIDINGSQFKNEFLGHLKQLEEEANGYAKNQLELAFGDKYKRPIFNGVNLAEDTVIRIRLIGPTYHIESFGSVYAEDPILTYSFRVYARQQHSREELEGTFKFVRFIDKHTDMIHKAMQQAATKMFDRAIGETQTEHEDKYSGATAVSLINSIQTDPSMRDLPGSMALLRFIHVNWPNMDKIEKLTAVEQYLEPMDGGSSQTIYDGEGIYTRVGPGQRADGRAASSTGIMREISGYPYNWTFKVTQTRKHYGAAYASTAGSPFFYEPDLRPLDRDEMDLPRKEEELEKDAEEVASTFGGPVVRNARGERMFEGKEEQIKKVIRETIRRKLRNMLK